MLWLKRLLFKAINTTLSGITYTLGGIPLSKLNDFQSYLYACSRKVWVSWKCLDVVGTSVAATPFTIIRGKDPKAATLPSDLQLLLDSPNSLMTWHDLVYITAFHVKAVGNAFWFKANCLPGGAKPKALFPLNPKRVWIVPGNTQGAVRGYVYQCNGVEMHLEPWEIIHFRRMHPDNDFYGIGDIEPAEDLFNEHINRNAFNAKQWANGAAPSSVLINEDQITDEAAWEQAKQKWQRQYGGVDNAGKTAWLTGKWKYQQLGLSAQEMQAIEQSKWNVEQICLQHGVPLSVLGLDKAANFATADIDNQRYKEYTVLPVLLLISAKINQDLLEGWNEDLKFVPQTTDLINVGKAMTDLAPAFDRGIININEIRKVLGLTTDENNPLWNQHYLSTALVPIEMAGIGADSGQIDQAAQGTVDRARGGAKPPGDQGGPKPGSEPA